jgi:hypothetical protein
MKNFLPLTELKVKNPKAQEKPYKVFGSGGLYLEILPSGTKSWRVRIFEGKAEKRITLGQWPDISLKEAVTWRLFKNIG